MTTTRPVFPPRAESTGELFRRTDISPEEFFQTLGRVRRDVRDEVERLIEWLDSTIDCDEDEAADDRPCDGDTDAEPSLGSFDRMSDQVKAWQATAFCNADVDCELDRCDNEPSLGSVNTHHCQTKWTEGNADDREGDPGCDDREEVCEDECAEHDGREPTLGWNEEKAALGRYPSLMGTRP
jgi:hypothetical protein